MPKSKGLEKEIKQKVERIFEEKRRKIGLGEVKLEVNVVDVATVGGPPVVGENVYAQAFPNETPPRVWLEIWPLDATDKEITETICHELIHIKHPELGEESEKFKKKVQTCKKRKNEHGK